MATKKMSGAEARVEVAAQDKRRALKAVGDAAGRLAASRARVAKQRRAFDKMIALAVSSKPRQPDWHQHPGPLPAAEVREAAGLTTMQLHRTMERYRKASARR